jgi:flagellar basal-body rod protein FlgF
MYYGLYLSAAGAHSQSQKLEVLSNNLANVDTVGFKKELALLEASDSEAIQQGLDYRGSRSLSDVGGGVEMNQTATDFQVGTLRSTGVLTDFALESPNAFFVVQRGDEQLLTRAGNFHLASDGRLLTQDGDAVLSTDNSPIELDPTLPWRALPGGLIEQSGDRSELAVRKATDLAQLRKAGLNCFEIPGRGTQSLLEDERRVRQGYLEMSSVNPVQEMVELIATSRAHEMNIRMIQHHDGMTGSLVNRLLRV